jgi:hypothetical protein
MTDNDKPESPSDDENARRVAELDWRERKLAQFEDRVREDAARLDEAYTELRERQAQANNEVIERAEREVDRQLRQQQFRNWLTAGIICVNVGLAGVYIGDATDPFGLNARPGGDEAVEPASPEQPAARQADTLFFDDCMQAVDRAYPGELRGRPLSHSVAQLENGLRLRHTISASSPEREITVVCDEIFTSLGVITSIVSRSDG